MSKLYITLGRVGDICSILPVLYRRFQETGEKPVLMVSREYASILEGVSYVEPLLYNGPHWELDKAVAKAEKINGQVIVAQVNGPTELIRIHAFNRAGLNSATTDSFVKDQWKLAGALDLWKEQPPLVFDKRDESREKALMDKLEIYYTGARKPIILVSLGGNTSPFPYSELLHELLTLKLKDWRIIDLSAIRADRFFDLLALYERADALIASDSAPLHLAAATPNLPVCALVNDKPAYWNGAPWRPNHVFHCRYSDFPKRYSELFGALKSHDNNLFSGRKASIVHLWNRSEEAKENQAAREKARDTWRDTYDSGFWISCPIEPGAVGKDSIQLGDTERHPFLRSAIQIGLMKAREKDLLCLTRSTTCFGLNITSQLLENAPCYSHRILSGYYHPAVDLFAGSRSFWESLFKEIPDLIMGRDRIWTMILADIFQKHGAKECPNTVFTEVVQDPPKSWVVPLRLKHNKKASEKWFEGRLDTIPAVSKQAECLPLNLSSLPKYAYNPSICSAGQNYWLTYRYHTLGNVATQLGIAEIERHGNASRTAKLPLAGHSLEDAKFFEFRGQRWISWIESDYSGQRQPHGVVKIGRLSDDWTIPEIIQPNYGGNDWTSLEKNWLWLESNNRLFCIYKTHPEQTVFELRDGQVVADSSHPQTAAWKFGEIKGGIVCKHGEDILRFFHSTLDNEDGKFGRRYYIGALVMESKPPFFVKAISREPLLTGSIEDALSPEERSRIPHYKGRVVFPGGAFKIKGGWILAIGVNDTACQLVKITDLKL